MSLTGSLFAGVSGLNAQGRAIGAIGDNIANISTVGFKAGEASFSSLVTGSTGVGGSGAGVISSNRIGVDQQGLIQSTGVSTDIAISGQGFFVVKDNPNAGEGEFSYTRAGSFRQDERGFFVNSAGYVLQGWPLDSEGRLPGEAGNLNTTSQNLLESVESVNTRDISGLAFATTSISLGLNLDAGESVLTGAGGTVDPQSTLNSGAASTDILAETVGEIEIGDILDVTLGDGTVFNFEYGGFGQTDDITANNIFASATTSQRFTTNAAAGATHLVEGDAFTITTATAGTVTFTFREFTPSASQRTFNSLDTLQEAIDGVAGLRANIAGGRLLVSPADAREAMTMADVGTATFIAQNSFGQNDNGWANAGTGVSTTVTSNNRFNTLDGLATLVNAQDGLSSTITSAANDASISITVDDPLQTISFTNSNSVFPAATHANNGDLITEFNLPAFTGTAGVDAAAFVFNPIYDATGVNGSNMASGDINPAFSRNIRVFDSLGGGHDVRISFVKADNNEWLVEAFVADPNDIITTAPDGQIASGSITFNGDGSLANVSNSLSQAIQVVWSNESEPSSITLDLGTAGAPAGTQGAAQIGLTDGLSQFNGAFNVQFADQNGAGSGLLSSLEVDEEGFIIANFSNGQSRDVFKIPIASFPNPNGLSPQAGNVFAASDASGTFSLNEAGDSGVGVLSVSALEGADVELAEELTKMIVTQRAFQANTQIITTVDELLEELNRI